MSACAPVGPASAPAAGDEAAMEPEGFDWQRYAGTELRYVGETQPLSDHVLSILPKFEEMTGIKVNTEILPWAQMVQKIRVELMASNEDMDVYQLPAGAEERNVWFDAGWLNDIGPWVDDPTMTHEGYDLWEDMGRDYLMAGYSSRGSLVSVPMQMSAMIGYYRKDLFVEYGIDGPPTTFEELEAAAQTVQEMSGGDIFGITMRGKPPVPTSVFKGFLGGMGIMWEDDEGVPLMDSEAAIAAFDFYGRLLRLYGPPGSPNIDHVGAVNIFSQGKAGMIIDDAVFRKDFQDPSKSVVAGDIGYFLMPAGPNGQRASAGGWSITVGGLSLKKEASWYLLQFISNKESMLKYVLDGGAVPRRSVYDTDDYKTQATQDDLDFVQVLLDSRAIGDFSPPAPPSIINLMRARESIAQVIVTSIEGGATCGPRLSRASRSCWRCSKSRKSKDTTGGRRRARRRPLSACRERCRCRRKRVRSRGGLRRLRTVLSWKASRAGEPGQAGPEPGDARSAGLLRRAFALIDRNLAFVLPAPAVIVILALMGYPFFFTLSLSLQRVNVTMTRFTFVGLDNLVEVLTEDARFLNALWITLYFTLASLALELVLAMIMALVMNRTFRGLGVIRTLFLLPLVATPTATSVIWLIMMEPSIGILNHFVEGLGLPPSLWVAGENSVGPSLVWINTWHGVPFVMLILLAGLRSLPTEPFEAARIDGASRLQEFFQITLPLLKPAIVVAMLFRAIDTLKVFDAIWIMTAGGPGRRSETLHVYSYLTAFEFYDLGYGSAVILVFMVIILIISAVLIRLRQRAWL